MTKGFGCCGFSQWASQPNYPNNPRLNPWMYFEQLLWLLNQKHSVKDALHIDRGLKLWFEFSSLTKTTKKMVNSNCIFGSLCIYVRM